MSTDILICSFPVRAILVLAVVVQWLLSAKCEAQYFWDGGGGAVDGNDFLARLRNPSIGQLADWQRKFGRSRMSNGPGVVAVPEPAGVLLALAFFVISALSNRKDIASLFNGIRNSTVAATASCACLATLFLTPNCCTAQSQPQNMLWDGSQGGNFNNVLNWSYYRDDSPTVRRDASHPPGMVDNAIFVLPGTPGNISVSLQSPQWVNALRFRNTSAGATVTLNDGSNGPQYILVNGGGIGIDPSFTGSTVTLNTAVGIRANQTWNVEDAGRSLHITREIDLNGQTLSLTGAGDFQFDGLFNNAHGNLLMNGAASSNLRINGFSQMDLLRSNSGTVTLAYTAGNTGIAEIELNGGTVRPAGGQLVFANALEVQAGGTIDSNDGQLDFSGSVTGGGNITKVGNGVLSFAGPTSGYTGTIYLNQGRLDAFGTTLPNSIVNNGVNVSVIGGGFYTGAITGAGLVSKYSPGELILAGGGNSFPKIDVHGGAVAGNTNTVRNQINFINGGTYLRLEQDFPGAPVFNGYMTGPGAFYKDAGGEITLTQPNSHTGGTFLRGGRLVVNDSSQLGNGGVQFDGGGLKAKASFDINRSLIMGSGGVIDTNGHNVSVSAPISGSGVLTKAGTGELRLSVANTYGGGIVVTNGSLRGNATNLRGTIVNNSELVLDIPNTQTFSGSVSGTGIIKKVGSGTLLMNGSFAGANSLQLLQGAIYGSPSSLPQSVYLDTPNISCFCLIMEGSGTFNGVMSGPDGFTVSNGTATITQAQQNVLGAYVASAGTLNVTGSIRNASVQGGGTLTGTGYVDSIVLNQGSQFSGSLTFDSLVNDSVEHTIQLESNNTIPYTYGQGPNGALNLPLPTVGLLQGQDYFDLFGGLVTLQGVVPNDVAGGAHWPILTAGNISISSSVSVEVSGGSSRFYELVGRELDGQDTLFLRETPIDFLEGDANGDGMVSAADAPIMAFSLFNPDDVLEVPTGGGGKRVYFDFREKLDLVDPEDQFIDFDDLKVFSELLAAAMGSVSAADAVIADAIATVLSNSQVPEPSTGGLLLLCAFGASATRFRVR